jgi:hypothetical protein
MVAMQSGPTGRAVETSNVIIGLTAFMGCLVVILALLVRSANW